MGVRTGVILGCIALASPVAAGVLPFEGAYGDDAGCGFYLYGAPPAGGYLLLTPDTLAAAHIGCDFGALAASQGGHFSVDAVCSPGGKMRVEIMDHGAAGWSATAGGVAFGPVPRCPDLPAQPQGTLRS